MTWDEVQDQLDIPSLEALTRYWKQTPPLNMMVAAYLGIDGPREAAKPDEATIEELMMTFPEKAYVKPRVGS